MLTPCKAPKSNNRMSRKNYSSNTNNIEESANFVVFELCDEIEIDTVVLANFEFFSSMFKLIRISVSSGGLEGASGVEWLKVGIFKTRNVRGLQVFPIRNLKGFYRYVRLDFLSHHGSEYYCPLSLVRIYGLTQIDAFRREQEEERRKIESIQILETEERRKD
ncbi:UNC-like C-terminal-domain-containing protein, partial [Phakopsora pachyrhizi]